MESVKLAFVGAGNMAEALIRGLLQSGEAKPGEIAASDISEARRTHVASAYGVRTTPDNVALAQAAGLIVLAVKPQGMEAIVREISDASRGKLVISIAAGVRLDQLSAWLGGDRAIVRTMPNTPALALAGMSVLCPNSACRPEDVEAARRIFAAVGDAVVIDREDLLDAVTALSGCGPGFVFEILDALAEGGAKLGLPPDLSRRLALQTLLGSAKLAAESELDPAALRNKVASPGGATVAGLDTLKKGKLRETLQSAMAAAARRSRELSS